MPPRQPGPSDDTAASFPAHERAAEQVRHRRLELGWTQDHLAERAGLSAATVRKVEAAAQPHYRDLTCTRLCAALGWAPDALDALRTTRRRPLLETRELLTTSSPASSPAPRTSGAPAPDSRSPSTRVTSPAAGTPSEAEIAALNGRIARLDARQWERLMAFVDGLTDDDR